jgi:hypothetical protein
MVSMRWSWFVAVLVSVVIVGLLRIGIDRWVFVEDTLGWLTGVISTFISRYILKERGVHGLGYFNPALDRIVFYSLASLVGAVVGFGAFYMMQRGRRSQSDVEAEVID